MVARIGLGGLFVLGAVHHYLEFSPIVQQMADRRLPVLRALLIVGPHSRPCAAYC